MLSGGAMPLLISEMDSKFMATILDRYMKAGSEFIRAVTFDAATSHGLIRRVFMGTLTEDDQLIVRNLPWMSQFTYKPMPSCVLPRLPVQIAMCEGEVRYGLPGACLLVQ